MTGRPNHNAYSSAELIILFKRRIRRITAAKGIEVKSQVQKAQNDTA